MGTSDIATKTNCVSLITLTLANHIIIICDLIYVKGYDQVVPICTLYLFRRIKHSRLQHFDHRIPLATHCDTHTHTHERRLNTHV